MQLLLTIYYNFDRARYVAVVLEGLDVATEEDQTVPSQQAIEHFFARWNGLFSEGSVSLIESPQLLMQMRALATRRVLWVVSEGGSRVTLETFFCTNRTWRTSSQQSG